MSKKTLAKLAAAGNIAVLQVKSNQQYLLDEVRFVTDYTKCKSRFNYTEKGHGRVESRIIEVFDFKHAKWPELQSCIKITKHSSKKKCGEYEDSTSVRVFVVNDIFDANTSDSITRGHWFIENKHHHIRDVQLKEDSRRIRKKPELMMVIRSFGYNLIQLNKQCQQFSTQIEYNKLNVEKLFGYRGIIL